MEPDKSLQKQTQKTVSSEYVPCGFDTDLNEIKNDGGKICRICLLVGDIPIFNNDRSLEKSEIIKTFGDVEISREDNYPKYICQSCVKLLDAAVLFRTTAKESELLLKRTSQNSSIVNGCRAPGFLKLKVEPHCDHIGGTEIENVIIKEEMIAAPFISENTPCVEEISLQNCNNTLTENTTDHELQITGHNSTDLLLVPKNYSCNTCNMEFQTSEAHSRHKKSMKHKKSRQSYKIECTVCLKKVSEAWYTRHVESHSSDNKDGKLQCPICNKSYSKTYFNYHLTRHNEDHKKAPPDRIECPICNKSYEKQYYKFHLAIHDNASSKYVCDTCGKSFIQLSAFKRHSLIHGSELAFKCTLCPYKGRHPGLVKTHMQTHTRDYQHRCMECPARFLTKSNLNKHLQRHKGPVDFKCETCKRGFYSKLELDRHFEADHLGVRNHVCNICGKTFGYRNAMMSHQLKVHKREKLTNGKGRLPLYLEAERKNNSSE